MKTNFLKCLCKARSNKDFKKVMRRAGEHDIQGLVQTITDVMRKKLPAGKKCIRSIIKNRRLFRHLVHPANSIKSKKRYMMQHGGGIGSALGVREWLPGRFHWQQHRYAEPAQPHQ